MGTEPAASREPRTAEITAFRTVTTNNSFVYGFTTWGAENASEGRDSQYPVSLESPYIYDLGTHRYGDASAASPGLRNYAKVTTAPSPNSPHSPSCTISWDDVNDWLRGVGRMLTRRMQLFVAVLAVITLGSSPNLIGLIRRLRSCGELGTSDRRALHGGRQQRPAPLPIREALNIRPAAAAAGGTGGLLRAADAAGGQLPRHRLVQGDHVEVRSVRHQPAGGIVERARAGYDRVGR